MSAPLDRLARWPVHPPPLPEESLSSWLTRTARANASTMAPWLRVTVGRTLNAVRMDMVEDRELWEVAARCTGVVDADAMRAMTLVDYMSRVKPTPFARQVVSDHRAGACIACLASDSIPHLRRAWRLEWLAWCPVHGTRMRQHCARCFTRLAFDQVPWQRSILSCPECGASLRAKPEDDTPPPAFVATALREAVPLALMTTEAWASAPEASVRWIETMYLRYWAHTVGHAQWPAWVEQLKLDTATEGASLAPALRDTWAFALAWHLARCPRDLLAELVARHRRQFRQCVPSGLPSCLSELRDVPRVTAKPRRWRPLGRQLPLALR